jgi:hypothetical protein
MGKRGDGNSRSCHGFRDSSGSLAMFAAILRAALRATSFICTAA